MVYRYICSPLHTSASLPISDTPAAMPPFASALPLRTSAPTLVLTVVKGYLTWNWALLTSNTSRELPSKQSTLWPSPFKTFPDTSRLILQIVSVMSSSVIFATNSSANVPGTPLYGQSPSSTQCAFVTAVVQSSLSSELTHLILFSLEVHSTDAKRLCFTH